MDYIEAIKAYKPINEQETNDKKVIIPSTYWKKIGTNIYEQRDFWKKQCRQIFTNR